MDLVLVMTLGSLVLAVASLAIGVGVHLLGLGRIASTGPLGLPGRRLREDASTCARAHRAATPLAWLTASVAAIAALGSLIAAPQGAAAEWAVLVVLSAVVLAVGLTLATWRAHAAL